MYLVLSTFLGPLDHMDSLKGHTHDVIFGIAEELRALPSAFGSQLRPDFKIRTLNHIPRHRNLPVSHYSLMESSVVLERAIKLAKCQEISTPYLQSFYMLVCQNRHHRMTQTRQSGKPQERTSPTLDIEPNQGPRTPTSSVSPPLLQRLQLFLASSNSHARLLLQRIRKKALNTTS